MGHTSYFIVWGWDPDWAGLVTWLWALLFG